MLETKLDTGDRVLECVVNDFKSSYNLLFINVEFIVDDYGRH